MGFLVYLKSHVDTPIKINVEKFYIDDEAYNFSKDGVGTVASFPVANVLYVVKDQSEGERE